MPFPPAASPQCPLCAGPTAPRYTVGDLNRRLSNQAFTYHRCQRCETLFLAPVPADLSPYYPSEYYDLPRSREALASGVGGERYKIDLVRKFVSGGRLLEIGPGTGGFAYLASDAGFDVDVIEMDATAARYLNDVIGVRAINAMADRETIMSRAPYDAIAMWHVIEHVRDPLTLLDAAAGALSDRGALIIAAPNPHAFQLAVFGKYWAHLDAPRHLYLLPADVLIARAQTHGLTLRLATTSDRGGLDWNVFGWEHSIFHATRRRTRSRTLARIARRMATLASPLERRSMRGCAYTLVFTRSKAA